MKNLIPHFIQSQLSQEQTHGSLTGFTMFVDLSGFTDLTQTLMKRGNVGAEQLSGILNDIFGPMVELVYQRGGFIPYYAGDAFTAIFPEGTISIENFLDTARHIRSLTHGEETMFGGFKIRVKIGLSFGQIDWGIVGSAKNKAFYFRGEAIEGCAESQKYAKQQEIVLDKAVHHFIDQLIRLESIHDGHYFLWNKPEELEKRALLEAKKTPPLEPKVAKLFLPKSVLKLNSQGEFRSIISIFISFKGVDNHELLDAFATIVLEELHSFSGYFKEVDFGDKGGVMVGFIGAPVSFENNVERVLEFNAALQERAAPLLQNTNLKYRVGITSGIAYTGIIGSAARCQYAAVGNTVNLAARLMSYSDWGEVQVDEEIQKSQSFRFKYQGKIDYKGFEHPITTFQLLGRNMTAKPAYAGSMIGRKEELTALLTLANQVAQKQQLGLVYVYGEAGIGKSRLSFELKNRLQQQIKTQWMICPADQILRKPFNPFITLLKNYFSQSPENTTAQNIASFDSIFGRLEKNITNISGEIGEKIQRDVRRMKSVLAVLIGIRIEGDDFWEELDAQARYRNTLSALSNFLLVEAHSSLLVLELEDGHWYDDYSKAFLDEFVRQIEGLPIFILVPSRYLDDGTKPLLFSKELLALKNISPLEIDLNILKPEAIRLFSEARLEGEISEDFFELLQRTTNGNPFYLEQVIEYFIESNLLSKHKNKWQVKDKNIKLSNSINSILTARIDRLSNLVKETVKAAAVIGREFEVPILTEVLLSNHAFREKNGNTKAVLKEQILSAEKGQIWRAMNELRYIFKHSLLREAVYDMQLRARLRELHEHIAVAIEKIYKNQLEERFVDLAFHYEHAEIAEKAHYYFKMAASYARRNFQNEQAVFYFDKLLAVLDEENDKEEYLKALLRKGSVLELIGHWEQGELGYIKALEIGKKIDNKLLSGKTHNRLGHLLMLKGNYEEARGYFNTAATLFEEIDDERSRCEVYGDLGNLNFRQGKYEEAKSYFTRSIQLGRLYNKDFNQAQIVANLGLTFMNQGNYDEGIRWQKDQLDICRKEGDKQGMATLYTNMGIVLLEKGDYDEALSCFENGLSLCEELGNKQLTSIAIGCLGSVYERKGDYLEAMNLFRKDLKITEELGDKQGISIALGLIGNLLKVEGKFEEAKEYLEKNLDLCKELGYQKGIAKAINALGDIFYNQKDYQAAIQCYNQAIDISRNIHNVLILGESLIEKSIVLIAENKLEEAQKHTLEALKISEEIGNTGLVFNAEILLAQICIQKADIDTAEQQLKKLLLQDLKQDQKAAIFYEFSRFSSSDIHRKKALALYRNLYRQTPQHLYQQRMIELAKATL